VGRAAYCRLLLVAVLLSACVGALAMEVVFEPTSLQFGAGESTAKTLTVKVRNIAAGTTINGLGLYFKFDATKLSIPVADVAWDAGLSLVGPEELAVAQGVYISTGLEDESVLTQASGEVALCALQVSKLAGLGVGETTTIEFNGDDPANPNAFYNQLSEAEPCTFPTLNASVAAAPDPARSLTVALAARRQKDPVGVQLGWTVGSADALQMQYSEDGTTWSNVTATQDLESKTLTWASGQPGTRTLHIRARATHLGEVWNGTASVPVSSTVGWVEAASTLVLDNETPNPASATGSGTSIVITFQADEALRRSSAETVGNYAVVDAGAVPAAVGDVIPVTGAELTAANAVTLTLGQALVEGERYTVTVQGVQDSVLNAMGSEALTLDMAVNPLLVAAAFVNKNAIRVTFNNDMDPASLQSGWELQPSGSVTAVTAVAGNAKAFTLATGDMAQARNYTVTAPAAARDTSERTILGTGRTAEFTSLRWHTFAAGVQLVGVPLAVTGRVLTCLGAWKVARYDASLGRCVIDQAAGGEEAFEFVGGHGYWAKYGSAKTVYFDAGPLAAPVETPVQAGWNIITPAADTKLAGLNPSPGFAWHYAPGTGWELVADLEGALNTGISDELRAWAGYFVKPSVAGNLTIGVAAADAQSSPPVPEGTRLVQVAAQAGGTWDVVNACGVGPSALQIPNPPSSGEGVDLYFVTTDGERAAVDVRTGDPCQSWELVASTALPDTAVTLSTADLSGIPAEYAVILTDLEANRRCYLRTATGYSFRSGAEGATRRFRLEIVSRDEATLVATLTAQAPGGSFVSVAYSLNSAANVSVEVRNIAGRPVKGLVADSLETAGNHSVAWNLTSESGLRVPNGRYIVTLTARTEDGQQASAVRTFSVNR